MPAGYSDMGENLLIRPELKDCSHEGTDHGTISNGGTLTLDYSTGKYHTATQGGTMTVALSNLPASGSYGELWLKVTHPATPTVTWPASVVHEGGSATATTSGTDLYRIKTTDAGTTVYVSAEANFS